MKTKQLTLAMSLMLSACSNLNNDAQINTNNYSSSDNRTQQENALESSLQFKNQYTAQLKRVNDAALAPSQTQTTDKQQVDLPAQYNINYYVRGLMQDLVSNLQYVNATTPVAVVSFVMLDSDYTQGNLLGNQIAESLIHEIHKFGIPVIDFKTTDYIRVTPQGDFAFTRDYEEVNPAMPARYFVGGTMLKNYDGFLINARIVGIQSKAVVASAQSFIPNHIVESILTSSTESTLFSNTFVTGSVAPPILSNGASRITENSQKTAGLNRIDESLDHNHSSNRVALIKD